jgi:hypothetical protein
VLSNGLIELVNSGEAVAIVGSGISTEAGLPSWGDLFTRIADAMDEQHMNTSAARALAGKKKLPEAFDGLAALTSRADVHARVSTLIEKVTSGSRHHERLADWPFRLYVTTNYDHLIERSSAGRLVAVGNRGVELHKVSADTRDVVWHMHGGSGIKTDASQLVVAKADYDDFYPASNAVEVLKAISKLHRCVFLGFGFNDEDFIHVLKAVGRLAHTGRPSFAFLAYDDDSAASKGHREEMRSAYNVEVIPYHKHGNNQSELHRLLDAYCPFVLRRSIEFGSPATGTPAYEPVATSLRVQSSLDLGELSATQPGLRRTLIAARVLAGVRERPGLSEKDLALSIQQNGLEESTVIDCIRTLRQSGLLAGGLACTLTPEYEKKTVKAQATLELARDRFLGSLAERAGSQIPVLEATAQTRVAATVARFLDDLCRQRGLGVAQNLVTSDVEQASRRTVALLQKLPEYLGTCSNRDEAIAAVCVTSELLTRPTEAEAAFLGLLCQCYFGQHLVGASDRLAKVDLDLIKGTCYLLDASVLVCLLAPGSQVHEFTAKLVEDLRRHGAVLATTDLFLDEVAEHANWALRLVTQHGEHSFEIMAALRGLGGYRSNQFLEGFYLGAVKGGSFSSYLANALATAKSDKITPDVLVGRLTSYGIAALAFQEWSGFDQSLFAERDVLQREIDRRRVGRGTYKRPRQTQAEAEVAIVVDRIRSRQLQPPGAQATDAFFLSSTRVVDCLPGLQRRISLLPEGLAQWLWCSEGASQKHAELVFEQLLWELAQEGVEFVDRKTLLRRFSGVVEAGKEDLALAIKDRREYLVAKYGPDPASAFSSTDPLDIPWTAKDVQKEALDRMQKAVASAQEAERLARTAAKITEKERQELNRFKAKKESRHKDAERKKRAAESRPGKKKSHKKRH